MLYLVIKLSLILVIFPLLINSCERVKILLLKHYKTIAFLFIENVFLLSLQSSNKLNEIIWDILIKKILKTTLRNKIDVYSKIFDFTKTVFKQKVYLLLR